MTAAPRLRTVCLGLGGNLDDPDSTLRSAIDALRDDPATSDLVHSTFRTTAPVGPVAQPPFRNAAAVLHTRRTPHDLLHLLLRIERDHGRDRSREERWGPRRLDLDILLVDRLIIRTRALDVPHPRLHERAFVLEPLVEIAPEAWHPLQYRTVYDLARDLGLVEDATGSDRPPSTIEPPR